MIDISIIEALDNASRICLLEGYEVGPVSILPAELTLNDQLPLRGAELKMLKSGASVCIWDDTPNFYLNYQAVDVAGYTEIWDLDVEFFSAAIAILLMENFTVKNSFFRRKKYIVTPATGSERLFLELL